MYIYILQCDGGKWYVGKTANVITTFDEHLAGRVSKWTALYKPIRVVTTHQTIERVGWNTDTDLHFYIVERMSNCGVPNVRGGKYDSMTLTKEQIIGISKELYGSDDLCHGCGSANHYIKNCPDNIIEDRLSRSRSHTRRSKSPKRVSISPTLSYSPRRGSPSKGSPSRRSPIPVCKQQSLTKRSKSPPKINIQRPINVCTLL